jgi:tetratricopeptide (TPR) repeat protein
VLRCLLEFRIDQRQTWLLRTAFLYGIGTTNNWALLGFFPLFLLALVRLKGLGEFLDRRFLLRMAFWGLAGLSLYLLLPAIYCSLGETEFWAPLKAYLREQKFALSLFQRPAFRIPALASLIPLLVLSVRWKSHTIQLADDTRIGIFITRASGHLVHIACFLAALWLGFNPVFSHAGVGATASGVLQRLGGGSFALLYVYLAALILGHCAGYMLLFGWENPRSRASSSARAVLLFTVLILPVLLVSRNIVQIRTTNGPALRNYAAQICADLPSGDSVVLGDDPEQLYLLRAELSARKRKDVLLLETPFLSYPSYQILMAEAWKSRWPLSPPLDRSQPIRPGRILKLLAGFVAREPVLSLEASLGFVSERLQARPLGRVYSITLRPARELIQPALAGAVLASNQQIWAMSWTNLLSGLARDVNKPANIQRSWTYSLQQSLKLSPEPNQTLSVLGSWYSKALNELGVQLQRAGQSSQAETWFQRAAGLNPDNLVAQINLEYNQQCRRGEKSGLKAESIKREFPDWFARPAFWREALRAGGPVDEPTFLFRTGRMFSANGFPRQAANEFARCAELAPDWPQPKLWLARSALEVNEFAQALDLTAAIEAAPPREPGALAQLLQTRAAAFRGLDQTNQAAAWLAGFVAKYGQHREVLLAGADAWAQAGRFDSELALLDQLLDREPERTEVLVLKGSALLKAARYDDAITVLNAALTATPSDDQARLCRAIAFLGADQLDAAGSDYEFLLRGKNTPDALFGLATVAWRKQDTNTAIRLYRQYLTNAIPGSPQYNAATERIGLSKYPAVIP